MRMIFVKKNIDISIVHSYAQRSLKRFAFMRFFIVTQIVKSCRRLCNFPYPV